MREAAVPVDGIGADPEKMMGQAIEVRSHRRSAGDADQPPRNRPTRNRDRAGEWNQRMGEGQGHDRFMPATPRHRESRNSKPPRRSKLHNYQYLKIERSQS